MAVPSPDGALGVVAPRPDPTLIVERVSMLATAGDLHDVADADRPRREPLRRRTVAELAIGVQASGQRRRARRVHGSAVPHQHRT